MSLLTDASDRFKADLLADDVAARQRLVGVYGSAYQRLAPEVERVARKIERARQAGDAPSQAWLYRVGRLSQLQEQAAREMADFGGQAEDLITRAQRQTAERGGQEAEELTRISLGEVGTRVDWNRVPKEALKDLVGNLSDGSPLSDLFNQYGPDAATALKDTLTSGLVAGWNPIRIATHFRENMAGNLNRALVVARTETLRVYRESTRRSFVQNSDVVNGWVWLATLTTRTCPCCWAMNGTHHGNEETLDGHPSCRCCMVPSTKSAKELGLGDATTSPADDIPSGESVFADLSDLDKRAILGDRGYQLYANGQVSLSDFVGRKENRAWGSMRYVLSPGQALAKAQAIGEISSARAAQFNREPSVSQALTDHYPVADKNIPNSSSSEAAVKQFNDGLAAAFDRADSIYRGVPWETLDIQLQQIQEGEGLLSGGWNMGERVASEVSTKVSLTLSPEVAARFGLTDQADVAIIKFKKAGLTNLAPRIYGQGEPATVLWEREITARGSAATLESIDHIVLVKRSNNFLATAEDLLADQAALEAKALAIEERFGVRVVIVHEGGPAEIMSSELSAALDPEAARLRANQASKISNLRKKLRAAGISEEEIEKEVRLQVPEYFKEPGPAPGIVGPGTIGPPPIQLPTTELDELTLQYFSKPAKLIYDPGQSLEDLIKYGRETLGRELTEAEVAQYRKLVKPALTEGEVTKLSNELFGRELSRDEFARLAGMPSDGAITLSVEDGQFVLKGTSEFVSRLERQIYRDSAGNVVMHQEALYLKANAPKGMGTRIFATQVREATSVGIKSLVTEAKGYLGAPENGYYTWARLGYNKNLGPMVKQAALEAGLGEVKTLHDVMSTEGGAAWWKANGKTFTGTFDLAEGSTSRKVLADYLELRNVHLIEEVTADSWKPVMTREEAKAWAADSTYKSTTFHVTSPTAKAAIESEGFALKAKQFGKVWGDGVYLAADEDVAAYYARQAKYNNFIPETIETQINVKKVFTHEVAADPALKKDPFFNAYLGGKPPHPLDILEKVPGGKARYEELHSAWIKAGSPGGAAVYPEGKFVAQVLQEHGYDALYVVDLSGITDSIGGSQLIVFDPRNITVIEEAVAPAVVEPIISQPVVTKAREFTSEDESQAWAEKHFREQWLKGTNATEDKAIRDYKESYYSTINGHLRGGRTLPENDAEIVRLIDAQFAKESTKLPEAVRVFRGINDPQLAALIEKGEAVGAVIEDPAYTSTTLGKRVANQFTSPRFAGGKTIVTIDLPEGLNVLPMNVFEKNIGEQELTLARGTKLQVLEVSPVDEKGVTHIRMGIAPADAKTTIIAGQEDVPIIKPAITPEPVPVAQTFRKFASQAEADTWGIKHSEAYLKQATEAEKAAIGEYTGNKFTYVNRWLRMPEKTASGAIELAKPIVEQLDKAMVKSVLKEAVTTYRGVQDASWAARFDQLKAGEVLEDLGYQSTSLNKEMSKAWVAGQPDAVLVELRAPAGTRAIFMTDEISASPGQSELLLDRGQKMRVVSTEVKDGVKHLVVEVVPTEGIVPVIAEPLPPPVVPQPLPPLMPKPVIVPPTPVPGELDPKEVARLKANAASRVSKMRAKLKKEGMAEEEIEKTVRKLVPEHFGGTGVINPQPVKLPQVVRPVIAEPIKPPSVVKPPEIVRKPGLEPLKPPPAGGPVGQRHPEVQRFWIKQKLGEGYSVEEIALVGQVQPAIIKETQLAMEREVAETAAKKAAAAAARPAPLMRGKEARQKIENAAAHLADDIKRATADVKEKQDLIDQLHKRMDKMKMPSSELDQARIDLKDLMDKRAPFNAHLRELKAQATEATAEIVETLFQDKGKANITVDYGQMGVPGKPLPKAAIEAAKSGLEEFAKMIGPGRVDDKTVNFSITTTNREFYRAGGNLMALKKTGSEVKVIVHEFGHWLEEHEPESRVLVQDFYRRRTQGESARKFNDLFGTKIFRDDEMTKVDNFADAYMGKVYKGGATEILSMGLEWMMSKPAALAEADPEMFDLIYDIIQGAHLQ